MQMFSFIYSLPNDLRLKYYESIIKNGVVCDELWDDIIFHIEKNFKKVSNPEEEIKEILKNIDVDEKETLLNLIRCNNKNLYDKLSTNIFNFEDIINVDQELVKVVLEKYNTEEIYKATMAASPNTKEFIKLLMRERDFRNTENSIGNVPISEIMDIHNKIIKEINDSKNTI